MYLHLKLTQSLIFLPEEHSRVHKTGLLLAVTEKRDKSPGTNLERQIVDWVMKNRKSVLIANIRNDKRWSIAVDYVPGYLSLMAVPMVLGEEVLGALVLLHRKENFFAMRGRDNFSFINLFSDSVVAFFQAGIYRYKIVGMID